VARSHPATLEAMDIKRLFQICAAVGVTTAELLRSLREAWSFPDAR
jgi:hypothetical protein